MSIDAALAAMTAHVDVQIPFPIGAVWDLLTDLPRMASLSPEVESARWLTDEGCAQGARFHARNRRGPLHWQVTGEVTVLESGMRVTLQRAAPLLGDAAVFPHVSK
jgi:hypothetical protein